MQNFSAHWNSESAEQVTGGQSFSSEPSPQSSSKSQTHLFCMHLPFLQVNSSDLQVSSEIILDGFVRIFVGIRSDLTARFLVAAIRTVGGVVAHPR
jgi:hypothetical protein